MAAGAYPRVKVRTLGLRPHFDEVSGAFQVAQRFPNSLGEFGTSQVFMGGDARKRGLSESLVGVVPALWRVCRPLCMPWTPLHGSIQLRML